MSRVAFVNGRYTAINQPAIHIEDRGYQFADGVYEVMKVAHRRFYHTERHLDRLERSLAELAIPMPMSRRALKLVVRETWRRNHLIDALIYLQVSRGVAPRNHAFKNTLKPSLVVTVRRITPPTRDEVENGVKVITLPDERWDNCHIKSVSLLPNVLARQKAAAVGAREAWLVDADGMITEGSSSNAYIIDPMGRLITQPLGRAILGGITRAVLLEVAHRSGIEVVERAFSVEEARGAREAFMTSTTSRVLPITNVDGNVIGNGHPGSVTERLAKLHAQTELEGTATEAVG